MAITSDQYDELMDVMQSMLKSMMSLRADMNQIKETIATLKHETHDQKLEVKALKGEPSAHSGYVTINAPTPAIKGGNVSVADIMKAHGVKKK